METLCRPLLVKRVSSGGAGGKSNRASSCALALLRPLPGHGSPRGVGNSGKDVVCPGTCGSPSKLPSIATKKAGRARVRNGGGNELGTASAQANQSTVELRNAPTHRPIGWGRGPIKGSQWEWPPQPLRDQWQDARTNWQGRRGALGDRKQKARI